MSISEITVLSFAAGLVIGLLAGSVVIHKIRNKIDKKRIDLMAETITKRIHSTYKIGNEYGVDIQVIQAMASGLSIARNIVYRFKNRG